MTPIKSLNYIIAKDLAPRDQIHLIPHYLLRRAHLLSECLTVTPSPSLDSMMDGNHAGRASQSLGTRVSISLNLLLGLYALKD